MFKILKNIELFLKKYFPLYKENLKFRSNSFKNGISITIMKVKGVGRKAMVARSTILCINFTNHTFN